MKYLKHVFCYAAVLLVISCASEQKKAETIIAPPSAINGHALFTFNCSQCHLPHKDFIGPSLAGVEARWKSKELLYDFIRNSAAVIEKDDYAKALFIKWKQAPMLPYPHLNDKEIDAILEYCNNAAAPK